jgi:ATP-dependent Clp protease ATP-binding subunit ClpC
MPKINVYLPDELAAAVKAAKIPVSVICQLALEQTLQDIAVSRTTRLTVDGEWPKAGLLGRFSPRARQALVVAIAEAEAVPHDLLGTEHLLLGILADRDNLGYRSLVELGVEPEDLEAEVRGSLGPATSKTEGRVPFDDLAKMALSAALTEALNFRHNYIGCEHLLLGVLATEHGLGSAVMRRVGLDLLSARRAVGNLLAGLVQSRADEAAAPPPVVRSSEMDEILRRLEAIEQRLAG